MISSHEGTPNSLNGLPSFQFNRKGHLQVLKKQEAKPYGAGCLGTESFTKKKFSWVQRNWKSKWKIFRFS